MIIILILWLEYPKTNANQKTIEKMKEYQGHSGYIEEQNDDIKSEYDTQTFITSDIDKEKGISISLMALSHIKMEM